GRLQVSRLYEMTSDSGVRDMLSFLLARDTMHQNQWLAAITELEEEGLETTPCPSSFPQDRELSHVSYQFLNFSEGNESQDGRWAAGPAPDGHGQFDYISMPAPEGHDNGELGSVDPRVHGTLQQPVTATVSA